MHAVCHDVFANSYLYYESIHNEFYKLLTCIVSWQFPYDNVAAASLMYSTYVHCLYTLCSHVFERCIAILNAMLCNNCKNYKWEFNLYDDSLKCPNNCNSIMQMYIYKSRCIRYTPSIYIFSNTLQAHTITQDCNNCII